MTFSQERRKREAHELNAVSCGVRSCTAASDAGLRIEEQVQASFIATTFCLDNLSYFLGIMGLPMNNIHNPTVVPSGPSTNHSAANGAPQEKMALMDLIAEKTRVEEELKALGSVLDSVRTAQKPLYAQY